MNIEAQTTETKAPAMLRALRCELAEMQVGTDESTMLAFAVRDLTRTYGLSKVLAAIGEDIDVGGSPFAEEPEDLECTCTSVEDYGSCPAHKPAGTDAHYSGVMLTASVEFGNQIGWCIAAPANMDEAPVQTFEAIQKLLEQHGYFVTTE